MLEIYVEPKAVSNALTLLPEIRLSASTIWTFMVWFTVCLTADSAHMAEDLHQALVFLAHNARLEPRCQSASAWLDGDSIVRYEETWAAESDLVRRVRSEAFRSVLEVMESSSSFPSIQFHLGITRRGLDYVDQVRGTGST